MDLTELKTALQEAITNPCTTCGCVSPMIRLLMENTQAGQTITIGNLVDAAVDSGKDIEHSRHCVGGWITLDGQHCPHVAQTRVRISLVRDGKPIAMDTDDNVYDEFVLGGFDDREVVLVSPIVRYVDGDEKMIVEAELSDKKATLTWDGKSAPTLDVSGIADECTDYTDIANVVIEAGFWINTMGDIVCPHQHQS